MQSRDASFRDAPSGVKVHEGRGDGLGLRVAVVVSRYHGEVTSLLRDGACQALRDSGVAPADVEVVVVPGSFELAFAVHQAARCGRFHAVVALGCLVKGETIHMDVIAREVVRSFGETQRDTGVPIGFGLLTVNDLVQAMARAGGAEGNKGDEAARAALGMANLRASLAGAP